MEQKIFVEIDYFTRIFAKTFKFVGKRADCLRIAPVELSFYKKRSLHLFELWQIHFVILATNQEWYHSLDQDGLKCWQSYDRTLSVMIQGTSSEWTKSLRLQGRKQSGIFFGCYSQYFFRENDGRNVSNALFFLTIQQFLILLLRGQFWVKFRWISSELGQQQTQEVTYKHP